MTTTRTRTLVSVSAKSLSEATPPVAVVEHTDVTGTYVETFATNRAAWDRYNALMDVLGLRRI
jgi:hypothetical protein